MKLLLVVLDGLADRPVKVLGGHTPLEAAHIPHLDWIATIGRTGLIQTVRKGIAPESDSAVLALLGYDPFKYYTGRGPLEAVGAGMKYVNGMLALRANFATLAGRRIIDRRVGRTLTTREAKALEAALNAKVKLRGVRCLFKATAGHRGVLLIWGPKLSAKISNTDPAYVAEEGVGTAVVRPSTLLVECAPLAKTREAALAAHLVNDYSAKARRVLEKHPINRKRKEARQLVANGLLLRDAGTEALRLFDLGKRSGKRWAVLADMPLEVGIGKLAGMSVIHIPPPKLTAVDYELRVRKTLTALRHYDAVYVHLKGPDIFGHEGLARQKAKAITMIDRHFFCPLLRHLNLHQTVLAVTADHSCVCEIKAHGPERVPVAIAGFGITADGVKRFTERECRKGALKLLGKELMPLLTKLSRRSAAQ